MFVLILATLVFSVRGSNADTGADWRTPYCFRGYCITFIEGEITAEAGLCVVIPCRFTTGSGFTPQYLVWYKCEPSKPKCDDSDIIYTRNRIYEVQSGFKGRVSLLEPDVTQGNCSIVVNDLTESDSGSYQLRVNGLLNGWGVGYTFSLRAIISVKGLTQRPTVKIPPLTEGQQTTLTCTAPGLCSGSFPEITWMWGGARGTPRVTGNNTAFKTEDLTAVTQRHSSTLTLNPSAKHHGTNITCKVSFANSISTEETVTLNVTYVKEVKITGNTSVKEGEALSLICSVESFPPALITWTKYSDEMQNKTETILQTDTVTDLRTDTETFLKKSGMDTFSILNVTAADSGLYICTAKHLNNTLMGKVNVTVIYVKEVKITGNKSVKEGEALSLICSVESFPPALITWTKYSDEMQNKTETILQNDTVTDLRTDTETFLKKSGMDTFSILNVTAADSGLYICTAKHLNNTLMGKVNVTVIYVKEVKITGNKSVKEGEALSLICSVESFPPALITWTKYSDEMQNKTETILQNDTVTELQNDTVTELQNDTGTFLKKSGMDTFSILNVTTADSGLYVCTAKHLNNTLMGKVNVTVIYMRKLVITGDTTVERGGALNLTCSVESFPRSHVTWTVRGSNTKLQNGADSDLQKDTGSATLFIPDVTAEHSGRYICTAQHVDTTVTTYADITVTWFSKILRTSGCVGQSEVLTCVCISEGFPLPTIKWPLLKNHTEYSVVTTVSNHTVNSTATVTVKDHSTSVECVSSNINGEAKENLTIRVSNQDGQPGEGHNTVSWPEVIIAFAIGVVLSAVLCCLAKKCHRKKPKSSGNLDETLEVVTSQEYPLIDAGQAVEDDQTYYQETAEEGGAVAAEIATSDLNGGPKDVEYASIDFSVMKRRSPREAAKKQETMETEYAEVKKAVKKETEENGGEEDEVLEGKEEQAMIKEDEESKQYVSEKEEGEEMAVYSSVKDVMDEM